MKILIGIDHLLERNIAVRTLEVLLPLFDDPYFEIEIVTLAHQMGRVGLPIENHRIYSTYLSKLAPSVDLLVKKSFLIPSALKTIKLKSGPDLFIALSSGWIHLFKDNLKDQTKVITYLIESNGYNHVPKGLVTKLLSAKLNSLLKKFSTHNSFLFSTQQEVFGREVDLKLEPVFQTDIFDFVRDSDFDFNYTHVCAFVDASTNLEDIAQLESCCEKKGQQLVVISTNPAPLKKVVSEKTQLRVMSRDIFNDFTRNSFFNIDLTGHEFPYMSLGSLSNGRPCLVIGDFKAELASDYGILYQSNFNASAFEQMYQVADQYDRAKMRRVALRYNGRIFKKRFFDFMKEHQLFSQS